MKIGAYNVGEYAQDTADSMGCAGYIEPPNRDWIMFFFSDGTAQIYTEREPTGGVIGEPIRIGPTEKP